MSALAHQFARLISPLHGCSPLTTLQDKLTICLINEVSPRMLAGQSGPFPAQNEPPRSDRVIADNWRGLYGSDPFSSIWPLTAICRIRRPSKRRNSREYINVCGVVPCDDGGSRSKSAIADLDNCLIAELGYSRVRLRALDIGPADISDP